MWGAISRNAHLQEVVADALDARRDAADPNQVGEHSIISLIRPSIVHALCGMHAQEFRMAHLVF
jgi:hypothetical protein